MEPDGRANNFWWKSVAMKRTVISRSSCRSMHFLKRNDINTRRPPAISDGENHTQGAWFHLAEAYAVRLIGVTSFGVGHIETKVARDGEYILVPATAHIHANDVVFGQVRRDF